MRKLQYQAVSVCVKHLTHSHRKVLIVFCQDWCKTISTHWRKTVRHNQVKRNPIFKNCIIKGYECQIFRSNYRIGNKALPQIVLNTLQPLFECGPISRVMKTTTRRAFSEPRRSSQKLCLPNNKCLFNYSHLPKRDRKYCRRQARLTREQPEAPGPNRRGLYRVRLFLLNRFNPWKRALLHRTMLTLNMPLAENRSTNSSWSKNALKW